MTAVTISNLTVRYDTGALVLDGVSLEIGDGEFFFLLGPSGCGKTTLLRSVAGFVEPTKGSIQFDGRDLTRTQVIDGVTSVPMAVFRDGFGKERHAQIGACAAAELIGAMEHAARAGKPHFVILSHGTEMQKPWSPLPDRIVARRFESVCQYLGRHRDTLPTGGVADLPLADPDSGGVSRASVLATTRRYVEQAVRRYL